VAAVAATPNAPQRRDRKHCKLFVFSTCFIRLLSWRRSSQSLSSSANLCAFLSL
jgi:hypothetical protein